MENYIPLNTYHSYIYRAIEYAVNYRKATKLKTNRFTIQILFTELTFERPASFCGCFLEYDDKLPDGEIEINGFRHYVWIRNLKFSDLMTRTP